MTRKLFTICAAASAVVCVVVIGTRLVAGGGLSHAYFHAGRVALVLHVDRDYLAVEVIRGYRDVRVFRLALGPDAPYVYFYVYDDECRIWKAFGLTGEVGTEHQGVNRDGAAAMITRDRSGPMVDEDNPPTEWPVRYCSVDLSCAELAAAAAVLPLGRLVAGVVWRLRRRRVGPEVCRRCGYDLRATPERCPECGAVPAGGAGTVSAP